MLNRLITIAVVIALVYFLLTMALPMLQKQFGGSSPVTESTAESADATCVDGAVQANDRLVSTARSYGQPPVDVDAWSNEVWKIESELQTARSTCSCGSDSCRAATQALDEMSALLSNLDGMVRGDSPGFANPGNQQERINQFLDQARSDIGF